MGGTRGRRAIKTPGALYYEQKRGHRIGLAAESWMMFLGISRAMSMGLCEKAMWLLDEGRTTKEDGRHLSSFVLRLSSRWYGFSESFYDSPISSRKLNV